MPQPAQIVTSGRRGVHKSVNLIFPIFFQNANWKFHLFTLLKDRLSRRIAQSGWKLLSQDVRQIYSWLTTGRCWRCSTCNTPLKLSNYAKADGVYYCKAHYKTLYTETSGTLKKSTSGLSSVPSASATPVMPSSELNTLSVVEKSVDPSTGEPMEKPDEPVEKPVGKSAEPVEEPVEKPIEKPIEKAAEKQDKITDKPDQKTTDKSTEKPADHQTDKPTEKPTGKQTDTQTEKPTEKQTDKPTEKPTDKQTEKPTDKQTDTQTEKPTDMQTDKPTQKPTDKQTDKPMEKPTDKQTDKPADPEILSPAAKKTQSKEDVEKMRARLAAMGITTKKPTSPSNTPSENPSDPPSSNPAANPSAVPSTNSSNTATAPNITVDPSTPLEKNPDVKESKEPPAPFIPSYSTFFPEEAAHVPSAPKPSTDSPGGPPSQPFQPDASAQPSQPEASAQPSQAAPQTEVEKMRARLAAMGIVTKPKEETPNSLADTNAPVPNVAVTSEMTDVRPNLGIAEAPERRTSMSGLSKPLAAAGVVGAAGMAYAVADNASVRSGGTSMPDFSQWGYDGAEAQPRYDASGRPNSPGSEFGIISGYDGPEAPTIVPDMYSRDMAVAGLATGAPSVAGAYADSFLNAYNAQDVPPPIPPPSQSRGYTPSHQDTEHYDAGPDKKELQDAKKKRKRRIMMGVLGSLGVLGLLSMIGAGIGGSVASRDFSPVETNSSSSTSSFSRSSISRSSISRSSLSRSRPLTGSSSSKKSTSRISRTATGSVTTSEMTTTELPSTTEEASTTLKSTKSSSKAVSSSVKSSASSSVKSTSVPTSASSAKSTSLSSAKSTSGGSTLTTPKSTAITSATGAFPPDFTGIASPLGRRAEPTVGVEEVLYE
jgi:hypothetical protein